MARLRRLRLVINHYYKEALSDNNMDDMFMEVYCEGLSPQEMNAVKGGTASPLCTCLKTDASQMRPPH